MVPSIKNVDKMPIEEFSREISALVMKTIKNELSSEDLTRENMMRVISEWKYSCEHNLTNESLNRIAYIGQAA